jgi:hypothetical protein
MLHSILFIKSAQRRFWSKVEKTEDCWLWRGSMVRDYGQFSVCNNHIMAHRYAYIITNGPVPEGMHLHHECRTPECVNPAHLLPVTPRQHRGLHDDFQVPANGKLHFRPNEADAKIIEACKAKLKVDEPEVLLLAIRHLAKLERITLS